MGKTPVEVHDAPGFVSNRVLMPMINEAIFCLYEGVGDGGGDRRGYEARDESSDGPPGARRPDRPRRLPRHPATSSSKGSAIPSTAPARCWSRWSTPAGWAASRAAASTTTAGKERRKTRTRMYCQVCGAPNRDDHEFCCPLPPEAAGALGLPARGGGGLRGGRRGELLLRRAPARADLDPRGGGQAHRRDRRQLLGALHKQEKNILINQTGLSALRELLEQKKYIGWEEWSELWESKMDYQLLALEKRERFLAIKERIAGLYHGDKRKLFLQLPGGRRVRPLRLRHRARGGGPRGRLQARPRQLRARLLPRRDPLQRGQQRGGAEPTSRASWRSSRTTTRGWSTAASSTTSAATTPAPRST